MSKIRVLDDHTINKIAAGEVIENPASVVKELVENSLDADATEISIEIKGGGRQLIRISDNGCGMSADDALLCLERHATSKIRQIEDIHDLMTMGFRGEAIPSIAAISKFTLLTAPRQEDDKTLAGTLVIIEGGRILSYASAARSPGTTIEVKSLFFNVPVRKKFQRSPNYDVQEILKILSILSLGHPSIKFELISDQKVLLNTALPLSECSFQEQLLRRIESVLGKDFASAMRPVSFQQDFYQVEGYIGLPTYTRHNRTGQYLFINRRAVHSPTVSFAVREGYGTMLAANRYPVFILHLQMPGGLIDVNVHPQKKEVRLRHEHHLKHSLIQAIQQGLKQDSFSKEEDQLKQEFYKPHYQSLSAPLEVKEEPFFFIETQSTFPVDSIKPLPTRKSTPTAQTREQALPFSPPKISPKILATIPGYLLLEPLSLEPAMRSSIGMQSLEGFCLIDQKAAHTRILYEKLLKKFYQEKSSDSQTLLIPITVELPTAEAALLKDNLSFFQKIGISIQEFGEKTFMIDALPSLIRKEELTSFLTAMLSDLKDFHDSRHFEHQKEKQLALSACRHALSSSKRLSLEEAQNLISRLLDCEFPFQCPAGYPTIAYLSGEDLAKQFQRKGKE